MAVDRKIYLFAGGGLLALLVLGAIAFVLFADLNAQKARLEAAASDALGMEVRLGRRPLLLERKDRGDARGRGLQPGVKTAADRRLDGTLLEPVGAGKDREGDKADGKRGDCPSGGGTDARRHRSRPDGSSRIRTLVADWMVDGGIARAKDVAMATNENRIALSGSLDFARERFDDVTVAIVDGKGCAKVRQKIRGPFRKPEVEKVSVLRSVAGPVLDLFERAEKLAGAQCEVFYAGSVPPPIR